MSDADTPIKKWLKVQRISQRRLALELGQTPGTVNGKVNGWIAWQPADLIFLHAAYGLSSDFVLGISSCADHEEASLLLTGRGTE